MQRTLTANVLTNDRTSSIRDHIRLRALERLYARLEDEYELSERAETLNRKLTVISETATTLADIVDTKRSLRLEIIVIVLIAFEVVIALYDIFVRGRH